MFLLDEHGSGSVNWKKNLIVLWTGVFLACASFTACIPFLPVYLQKELHVPPDQLNLWAGLVYAVTFLGATFMAPYWGAWADRVGQRKMAIRAGFGLAVTYMLGAIVQTAPQMLAVRILTGLISGFVPASMSLVSSTLPGEKLGWGMGWMQAALASGNILGPLLGGYLSVWFGMRTSFFVGSGCLFLVTMMVIFFVRDIPISKETRRQDMHVVRDLRLALQNRGLLYVMFMFFLVQTCIMTIQPLITLYVEKLMGGAGDASELLPPQEEGLQLSGAVPNINSTLVEVTPPEMRGKAFGLTTSAQQFGGVVGPLLGGFLGDHMPTKFVLFTTGVILLSAALYTVRTRLRKTM